MSSVLMAAIGIGFLIFIHELGHYLCARLAGVRVEVFSLGFGQRLFGFVWRGTDYRVSLVPVGGYVRVAGEDPTQRVGLRPDDLHAKGFGARFLFFSGGVVMNLAFALVAFPIVFNAGVEFTAPRIGSVDAGSAAWEAGLEPGDRVVRVDGKEIYDFDNMRVEVALAGGRVMDFEIARGDETLVVGVRPRYSDTRGLYEIGVHPAFAPEPARVRAVDSGSPAAQAGLRAGDRIREVNGISAVGAAAEDAFGTAVDAIGQPVDLLVERDGTEHELTFLPESKRAPTALIGVLAASRTVRGMRPRVAVLERLGLEHGDVVLALDGEPFAGAGIEAARQGPDELSLRVRREDREFELTTAVTPEDRAAFVENVALGSDATGIAVVPVEGSPAENAGIRPGDEIVAAAGRELDAWPDLIDVVRSAGDAQITFSVRRLGTGNVDEIVVTPERSLLADLGFDREFGYLRHTFRVESVGGAVEAGLVASIDLVKQLYVTLKGLLTGKVAARNLGGIVQISRVSYHYAERGWALFVYFLALLSINLAFINVLPIPVLDGGHLLFLLIERVKGSPVSARVLTYSQILGLVFVIALMLFVTYNDILKLL